MVTQARPASISPFLIHVLSNIVRWGCSGFIGYSGAVIGFSTFGPAIAVGLGLWDNTTAASLAFSGTLAFSGIVGTPVGGVLLDTWVQHDVSAVSRSTGDANTRRLTRALDLSLALCSFGAIVIANAAYARRAVVFLVYMGMGTLPLFAATAAMNVAVFESVPRCHIAPIWRGRSIYETVFSCKNFIFSFVGVTEPLPRASLSLSCMLSAMYQCRLLSVH